MDSRKFLFMTNLYFTPCKCLNNEHISIMLCHENELLSSMEGRNDAWHHCSECPRALEWSSWHNSPMDQIKPEVTCWASSKLDLITANSRVNCLLWSHYHWHRFMARRGWVWVHWYMSHVCVFPQLTIILVFSGPIWSSAVSPFRIFRKQLTEGQLSGLPMETIQLCCICFHWGL